MKEVCGFLCYKLNLVVQSCLTLWDPMDSSTPGFPVLHHLPVCSNSCPLSQWCHPTISSSVAPFCFWPSVFPSIRVFSSDSALFIRWPEYWSFSISTFNEYWKFFESWVLSQPFHSSFTIIKRVFSSSSLSAIRMVLSAYLRLLILLLAILIPVCESWFQFVSPAFCMMFSACKLNKQGDSI